MNGPAWTGLISGIMIALIALVGTIRTARVAKLSNDRVAAIDGWKEWREDAQKLRAERDELATQIKTLRTECERIATELDAVEQRLDGCVSWIKAVIPALKAAGMSYPAIPRGITETDPGFPPIRRRDGPRR